MAIERTLSIIKPDATRRNLIGKINSKFEENGLNIIAIKKIYLQKKLAEQFYAIHSDKPFFNELCDFMSSYPIIVQVLEGEGAVAKNRQVMGATNPEDADNGTIRKDFAISMTENSVHGSDSVENAKNEISFFFSETEITI
ncbi:nucleoside-diphosphate kinase [Alphaproteobacteria bacterium]|nr:nucleoside-diphosphate kinase [Alphaproteobacteria bacterium]